MQVPGSVTKSRLEPSDSYSVSRRPSSSQRFLERQTSFNSDDHPDRVLVIPYNANNGPDSPNTYRSYRRKSPAADPDSVNTQQRLNNNSFKTSRDKLSSAADPDSVKSHRVRLSHGQRTIDNDTDSSKVQSRSSPTPIFHRDHERRDCHGYIDSVKKHIIRSSPDFLTPEKNDRRNPDSENISHLRTSPTTKKLRKPKSPEVDSDSVKGRQSSSCAALSVSEKYDPDSENLQRHSTLPRHRRKIENDTDSINERRPSRDAAVSGEKADISGCPDSENVHRQHHPVTTLASRSRRSVERRQVDGDTDSIKGRGYRRNSLISQSERPTGSCGSRQETDLADEGDIHGAPPAADGGDSVIFYTKQIPRRKIKLTTSKSSAKTKQGSSGGTECLRSAGLTSEDEEGEGRGYGSSDLTAKKTSQTRTRANSSNGHQEWSGGDSRPTASRPRRNGNGKRPESAVASNSISRHHATDERRSR